jgi:hypothetical protein
VDRYEHHRLPEALLPGGPDPLRPKNPVFSWLPQSGARPILC